MKTAIIGIIFLAIGVLLAQEFTFRDDVNFQNAIAFFTEFNNGNSGMATTINWNNGNKQLSTLTDNVTYTFTAPPGPCNVILRVVQDATGGRTATWPASVEWPGGTTPTITTAANSVDVIACYYDGTEYNCVASQDFR